MPPSLILSDVVDEVNWARLAEIFNGTPLREREPAPLEALFRNSPCCCFAYIGPTLIGAGRALTDRVSWTLILDVVIDPDLQRRGHGRKVVEFLIERAGARNVMLHAAPGTEGFYRQMSFRRMSTALARFSDVDRATFLGYVESEVADLGTSRGGIGLSV